MKCADNMSVSDAIETLDRLVPDSKGGLPEELFFYISRTTPLVNVDLLIKDETGRTLLSWRDDRYTGTGWHLPGGIVRFKETLETRLRKVAETEVGADIKFETVPMALNQIINTDRDIRGHFISVLYRCYLPGTFIPSNEGLAAGEAGYLMWQERCPKNLLKVHEIYRKYI